MKDDFGKEFMSQEKLSKKRLRQAFEANNINNFNNLDKAQQDQILSKQYFFYQKYHEIYKDCQFSAITPEIYCQQIQQEKQAADRFNIMLQERILDSAMLKRSFTGYTAGARAQTSLSTFLREIHGTIVEHAFNENKDKLITNIGLRTNKYMPDMITQESPTAYNTQKNIEKKNPVAEEGNPTKVNPYTREAERDKAREKGNNEYQVIADKKRHKYSLGAKAAEDKKITEKITQEKLDKGLLGLMKSDEANCQYDQPKVLQHGLETIKKGQIGQIDENSKKKAIEILKQEYYYKQDEYHKSPDRSPENSPRSSGEETPSPKEQPF